VKPRRVRQCPKCGKCKTRISETRDCDSGAARRRRHICVACGTRWSTEERVVGEDIVFKDPEVLTRSMCSVLFSIAEAEAVLKACIASLSPITTTQGNPQ
jgi:transcriptional regulator NrdR family protein